MTLSRTWYSRTEVSVPDTSSYENMVDSRTWLFKALLKGEVSTGNVGSTGAAPVGAAWTCKGSSDASTAGMDNTDRWTATYDQSKIVWAVSGAHSWIVLQAPTAMHASFYLLVDRIGADSGFNQVYISYNPFTGGSTTARPTSTTEQNVAHAAFPGVFMMAGDFTLASSQKVHYTVDANGNFYMLCGNQGTGKINNAQFCLSLQDAKVGDNAPICWFADWDLGGTLSFYSRLTDDIANNNTFMRTYLNTGGGRVSAISPAWAETAWQDASNGQSTVNPIDGAWDALPVYIAMGITGNKGIRGRLPDCLWTSLAAGDGAFAPNTGSPERLNYKGLLIPMVGSFTL